MKDGGDPWQPRSRGTFAEFLPVKFPDIGQFILWFAIRSRCQGFPPAKILHHSLHQFGAAKNADEVFLRTI